MTPAEDEQRLGRWRAEIDRIDEKIGDLLAARRRLTVLASSIRNPEKPGTAPRDAEREREVVRNVRRRIRAGGFLGDYDVEAIYDPIFAATRGELDGGEDS